MRILNIQRMSTEDGPGLRTTVFLKGCPLKCKWCHNPESIPYKQDKEWIQSSCIFCLDCIEICEQNAINLENNKIVLNRNLCVLCKKCIEKCPTNALKLIGEEISVLDLSKELLKDKAYFSNNGGITISGGEALLQKDEVIKLVKILKKENIHITIDTSGYTDFKNIESVIPFVDLFLYDLKLDSDELHQVFCNTSNNLIKENLINLNHYTNQFWIRTPIIPDATDSVENIIGISNFLNNNNIDFQRWELCAFNNLCKDKYDRLYLDWEFKDSELITKEKMQTLVGVAKKILPDKEIFYTGVTKLEVNHE